jgi:hypothetical protein
MRLSSVMFFSFSSAMVMFTCEWMGCVGGNAEREVLQRIQPCGLQQIQPALTSFESSPKLIWSGGAPGKRWPHFDGELP